jgi:Rrf2 family cysteine metabolism transcriptional repressor
MPICCCYEWKLTCIVAKVYKVYYVDGVLWNDRPMKISQKGLYALQAMMMLARRHHEGAIKIRDIAYEEVLPEKFLELILLELKNARIVESVRGAKGGYQLRREPAEIYLSEIIRLIDGPLAPFGDAEQLRELIDRDLPHRALYQVFLDVRDAAARILDNTTLADLIIEHRPRTGKISKRVNQKHGNQKKDTARVLPMVVGAHKGE